MFVEQMQVGPIFHSGTRKGHKPLYDGLFVIFQEMPSGPYSSQ